MKDIKPVKGKFILDKAIAEGEHQEQDFKFAISDAAKIARTISAFANRTGGRLLIGVKDNGSVAGVRNDEDIYVVEQAATMYCRPAQNVKFTALKYAQGLMVIKADIAPAAVLPVLAKDTDGHWKAYYRVADENIAAHPLMVKAWMSEAHGGDSTFTFTPESTHMLDILHSEPDGMTPERLSLLSKLPMHTASETIIRLICAKLIRFEHTHGRFIILPEQR